MNGAHIIDVLQLTPVQTMLPMRKLGRKWEDLLGNLELNLLILVRKMIYDIRLDI